MGANLDVLSNGGTSDTGAAFPYIKSHLPNWNGDDLVNPATGLVCKPSEGRDDGGNMALLSNTGKFAIEDTDIYAEYGVFTVEDEPVQSSNNANFFFPTDATGVNSGDLFSGDYDQAKGLFPNFQDLSTTLKSEVAQLAADVGSKTAEVSTAIKSPANEIWVVELVPQGGDTTPGAGVDQVFEDVNGDGLVVINGGLKNANWHIDNSDLLFFGPSSLTALVKVRSNMLVTNGSVQRCGDGPPILFELKGGGNAPVFAGSSAVLSNVALWELQNDVNDKKNKIINCQNCQGCAQFIGDKVELFNGRFQKCTAGNGTPPNGSGKTTALS